MIEVCKQPCSECGFTKDGTRNTLYAEAISMIANGTVFPCHMYLKSITGSENEGVEKLTHVKVCKGYVAFIKKNFPGIIETYRETHQYVWNQDLLPQITDKDMENILTVDELIERHQALKSMTFLRKV